MLWCPLSKCEGAAFPFSPLGDCGFLAAVADGVGGAQAGGTASSEALRLLRLHLENAAAGQGEASGGFLLSRVAYAVAIDIRQLAASSAALSGMATTLSAVWLHKGQAHILQVGDSRVYLFRQGRLKLLTVDQSPVGRRLAAGELSEEQARLTPGRNIIDQAIGMDPLHLMPAVDSLAVHPRDLFVISSDGFHDAFLIRELEPLLAANAHRSLEDMARELVLIAARLHGRDNATAVFLRVSAGSGLPSL